MNPVNYNKLNTMNTCPRNLYMATFGSELVLTPFFEPIWNNNGKLIALEMLTRIKDIKSNISISPEEYFLLESAGNLLHILSWQLDIISMLLPLCYEKKILISINLARNVASSLLRPDLAEKVMSLSPVIRFEINESGIPSGIMLKDDPIFSELAHLAPLWLDDFGCGTTSIPLLLDGGFEVIKVGCKLISSLSKRQSGVKFLSGLRSISLDNNIPLIAEGISDSERWHLCHKSGVYASQGWLWRGVTYDEIFTLPAFLPEVNQKK